MPAHSISQLSLCATWVQAYTQSSACPLWIPCIDLMNFYPMSTSAPDPRLMGPRQPLLLRNFDTCTFFFCPLFIGKIDDNVSKALVAMRASTLRLDSMTEGTVRLAAGAFLPCEDWGARYRCHTPLTIMAQLTCFCTCMLNRRPGA